MSEDVIRVELLGRPPRHAVKWTYRYVHPLDECANGGLEWRVTIQEFTPGLISFTHPCCSMCGSEPVVDGFYKEVDDDAPWSRVRLSPQD